MGRTTVRLRILRFHNCEGCVRKVGIALHQLHGVELLEFDPETGNVTLSSDKHPEVIKDTIERKTRKNVVILSEEVINPRINQNLNIPLNPQSTVNVQDLAETLLRVSQAEGLNCVELVGDLSSNSFRLSFSQRLPDSVYNMGDGDYEFLPRTTSEPSVPPRTTTGQVPVYGYPATGVGSCTTCSHDHIPSKCCTIL